MPKCRQTAFSPHFPELQSVCSIRWCNRLLNNRQTWYELSYLSLCWCLHMEESCCIFHLILTALCLLICYCPLLENHKQLCQASGKENDWNFEDVTKLPKCYITLQLKYRGQKDTTRTTRALCPQCRARFTALPLLSSSPVSVGS